MKRSGSIGVSAHLSKKKLCREKRIDQYTDSDIEYSDKRRAEYDDSFMESNTNVINGRNKVCREECAICDRKIPITARYKQGQDNVKVIKKDILITKQDSGYDSGSFDDEDDTIIANDTSQDILSYGVKDYEKILTIKLQTVRKIKSLYVELL